MSFVQTISGVRRRFSTAADLIHHIQTYSQRPVSIQLWPAIEDIGNLNFDLFVEIGEFLGINTAPYVTKKNFIDEALISTRNKIAHGERLEVDDDSVQTAFSEVIALSRAFKTDIENGATAKLYLR